MINNIRYFILLLGCILFNSCSSEKEAIVVPENYNLSLSVNTDHIYTVFGSMKDSILVCLGDSADKQLFVSTLLYDQQGGLADSICSFSKKLENMSCQFEDIEEGKYVIITIETLIDKNEDGYSCSWLMEKMGNLNTAEIRSSGSALPYDAILGIAYTEILLDSDKTVTVTPNPMGSIIETTWEGLCRADSYRFALSQKNPPIGYRLNPSLGEDDRLITSDGTENTWKPIGYCNVLNNHTRAWFVPGKGDVEYTWGHWDNGKETGTDSFIEYPHGNPSIHFHIEQGKTYYAHCRYNVLTGGDVFIGDADKLKRWLDNLDPSPFYYKEPNFKYGLNFSEVLEDMRRFEGHTNPIEHDEDYYYITYNNICSAKKMEYWFFSYSDELYLVNVYFDKLNVQKNQIETFIDELGYTPWRNTPSGCHYLSSDMKVRLYLSEKDSEWLVQYY